MNKRSIYESQCTTLLISTQIYCLCLHQLLLENGVVTWAEMGLCSRIG